MAYTTSQIDAALDDISAKLARIRRALSQSKAYFGKASAEVDAISADYPNLVTEIDALAGTDAWETQVKARKDRLVAEFNATKTAASDGETALQGIDV
jgi:hypothetical protein